MIFEESGKVAYKAEGGSSGTAYLEASFTASGAEYVLGTNKYSDEQVLLQVLEGGYEEVSRFENTN